jgi:hypothetical protein
MAGEHVYPVGDSIQHDTVGECACGPRKVDGLIVHVRQDDSNVVRGYD